MREDSRTAAAFAAAVWPIYIRPIMDTNRLHNHDLDLQRESVVSLKDLCWLAYLYPVRWIARIAPGVVLGLQRPGGWLAKRFAKAQRRRLATRMRVAGFAEDRIDSLIDRYLDRAVWRALLDLVIDHAAPQIRPDAIAVEGLEHLRNAQAMGRGVLLASGHFFASRLAKRVLRDRGLPIVSVRHPAPPDPGAGRVGRQWLQACYMRFLHTVIGDEIFIETPDCSLKIMQRLRAGELVNVHVDSPFASRSVKHPFLGRDQTFTTNFIRLASLAGSPIVPFFFSGDHRRLRITFEPPLDPAGPPDGLLSCILHRLEVEVRLRPEDYELWIML